MAALNAPRRVTVALPLTGELDHGGHAWAMLNWVLGLQHCGHEVHVVEPCPRPTAREADRPVEPAVSAASDILRRHGFAGSFTVAGSDARWTAGDLDPRGLRSLLARTEVLLNLSGVWRDAVVSTIAHRVYLDLDPGFTQIWHEDGVDVGLDGHTAYVTVGLDVGREPSPTPTAGRSWIPTVPPVVVRHWEPAMPPAVTAPFSTVANWRSYGTAWHHGVRHGQKVHSFRNLLALPTRCSVPVEVALRIHPDEIADLADLDRWSWRRSDPRTVATPEDYRRFVMSSRGEFGIAKEGYVVGRTGWVSDRTACYLAAGRPVVVQDTGGTASLPDHDGFVRFRTLDEAVDSLEAVDRNWAAHAAGAAALARSRFAHDVVVPAVLEAAT